MLVAIAMIACSSVSQAQQQEPSLKPAISPPGASPRPNMLLEINYRLNGPPSYCTVEGPEVKPHWIWVTQFVRLEDHRPKPGDVLDMAVWAVKLEAQYNGETANVRVTLLRGSRATQQEELVKTYRVGLNEERILDELKPHGIKPFTIKLIQDVPAIPPPPSFNFLTSSVDVVRVESLNQPRPAYQITFRNLSEKNIWAISVNTTTDGRPGVSALFQAEDGRPLIEAGGFSEQYLSVAIPGPIATTMTRSNTINIRSVVFSDLTFEGEMGAACMFETFVVGRRLWLERVLPLFEEELTKSHRDAIEAAKEFKEKVSDLRYDRTPEELRKSSVVSTRCGSPFDSKDTATQSLKLQLLRELDQIIETRPAPPVNFNSWLKERHSRYKAWLARLL